MAEEAKNSIKDLCNSFRCAFRGLKYAISYERNFQIEILAASFIIALIFIFQIKSWQAIILISTIALVLVMELANTVVERVIDILKPRIHPYVRLIKDMMAAAVLISSIFAVVVGIIIFYPYFRELFTF